MAIDKIHVAEKGRNLEEEAQVVVPAVTPAPVAAPVNQTDIAAQTNVDDSNGNIVPGPGVGIPAQTEQAVVTQPVTVGQPNSEVSEFAQGKAAAESGIPVVVQPAETVMVKPVTTTPYLYDWSSGMSFNDAYKQNKHNAREIMDDQRRWAQENGKPLNVYDWATYPEHDADKTKEQNEAEIKKAEKKKKWDALGTFLTHLGNAVGAAGWGGSLKLEDPVKLSERQREIFEKTQALRRQRNKDMMDAYMKQYNTERQARLDETRAQNEKRKLDRLDEDQRLKIKKQDWLEKYQQGVLDDKAERRRIQEEFNQGKISDMERRTSIAELNAFTSRMRENRQAAGTTVEVHKPDGSVEKKVTTPNTNKASGNGNKYSKYKKAQQNDYSQYKRKQQ